MIRDRKSDSARRAEDETGTRLVLVRHGHSAAQERRVIGGHAGCTSLSDQVQRQAAALPDRLVSSGELAGAAALYSSVMPRAVETGFILSVALRLPEVRQECDLCERHPGEGDGLWIKPVNTSLTEWRVAANPFLGRDALPVQLVRFNDHPHVRG